MKRRVSRVLMIAVALAVAGIFLWFWTTPRVNYAAAGVVCRQLYAAAGTSLDTARVDGKAPLERTRGDLNPVRCGDLRSAGYLSP